MSSAREIRQKIGSVKSTQKITRAMELVAASKMRKAQDRMALSKPYATKMRQVIRHVASCHSEFNHPYLVRRETIKRVGYVIVSTDRGLCGGLNVNLFRALIQDMRRWNDQGVEQDICVFGRKAEAFFERFGANIVTTATHLGDAPALTSLIGSVKVMLDRYDAGQIDAIFIAYNEFVNTMVQKPVIRELLPLEADEQAADLDHHWDYIYEPDDAQVLMTQLLTRYVESQVYQAVIENIACEQSARMVAMKSASENAGDLIKELQLIYNKARQASITQEIAEICSGAAAVE